MIGKTRFFYGWIIIAVCWICYGFGIAPAYYSWGQFAPALIEDLELSRANFGLIFGLFVFIYSAVGPLVGLLQDHVGIRRTMTLGGALSALGFWWMSHADSFADCIIGFSVLGGVGVGLLTILPAQTLGQNWFLKYRARAIAVILSAGAIVGMTVPPIDSWLLENRTWSDGWLIIAGISLSLSVLAFLLVRDKPEDIGLFRDGKNTDPEGPAATETTGEPEWTAAQAIRTPQFSLMFCCEVAQRLPWIFVVSHGPLHLNDMGLPSTTVAAVFSWMILVSIAGRFSGSLGDIISSQKLLAIALIMEALGVLGMMFTSTPAMAYVCVTLIGVGFGAGYINLAVVFSEFFGRRAFGITRGTVFLLSGMIAALAPWFAGVIYDVNGSYTILLLVIPAMGVVGTFIAILCRHPGPAPAPE